LTSGERLSFLDGSPTHLRNGSLVRTARSSLARTTLVPFVDLALRPKPITPVIAGSAPTRLPELVSASCDLLLEVQVSVYSQISHSVEDVFASIHKCFFGFHAVEVC